MVLDNTSKPPTSEPEASESLDLLPSLLYYMDKREKKLIKLAVKAQDCVSHEKAQKILKKEQKIRGKMT